MQRNKQTARTVLKALQPSSFVSTNTHSSVVSPISVVLQSNKFEEVEIKVYKTSDKLGDAARLHESHKKHMESLNLGCIKSIDDEWITSNNCYFIIAQLSTTKEIIAGARLQIKTSNNTLPMEKALTSMGKHINANIIENYVTAEICGLWSSKKAILMGIPSTLLGNAAVAAAYLLKLKTVFVFCSPKSVSISKQCGFEQDCSLCNESTLAYPTAQIISTILSLKNLQSLPAKEMEEKENILSLINNPFQKKTFDRKGSKTVVNINLENIFHNSIAA